jgi:hypothetical protein
MISVTHDSVSVPGETVERTRLAGVLVQKFNQLTGISHRQTAQQESVRERKNSRIGADAERQGENGNNAKPRGF